MRVSTLALGLLVVLLAVCPAWGTQVRVPGDYSTIVAANNAATAGDTIYFTRGDTTFVSDTLHVKSCTFLYDGADPKPRWTPASTERHAIYRDRAGHPTFIGIEFRSDGTPRDKKFAEFNTCGATFNDCDWRNIIGSGPHDAPLESVGTAIASDSLVIVSCSWDTTHGPLDGGAFLASDSNVYVRDTTFRRCSTTGDGGVMAGTYSSAASQAIHWRNVLIADCSSEGVGALGGGGAIFALVATETDFRMTNCTIDGYSQPDSTNGVVNVYELAPQITVFDRVIISNADCRAFYSDCSADTVLNCDAYGTKQDWFGPLGATVVGETLHVDPKYNSTSRAASGHYQARALAVYGSWGYMGWERYLFPHRAIAARNRRRR